MNGPSDPRLYPDRPLVGVSAFIARRGSVLLVRRAKPPLAWSLPGGLVELGETLEQAVRREVREETGLGVEVVRLATTLDIIRHDDAGAVSHHFVLAVFVARPGDGTLRAGDDAAEAEWVRGEDVSARELTPGTAALIGELLASDPG